MQLLLRVFEHLLTPQIEEVIRVGVELQAVLTVLPGNRKTSPTVEAPSFELNLEWDRSMKVSALYNHL